MGQCCTITYTAPNSVQLEIYLSTLNILWCLQVQLLDTLASAVADDSLQQQLSKAGLVVYSSALLTPYERIYSRSALRNMR